MTKTKQTSQWNNTLPNWLNILCVLCILSALVYGAIVFTNGNYDSSSPWIVNFKSFIPSFIIALMYGIILFITNFFAVADLSTTFLVIFFITGLIFISIGLYLKNDSDKSTLFHIAATFLGIATGIPFGEKIRRAEQDRQNRTN